MEAKKALVIQDSDDDLREKLSFAVESLSGYEVLAAGSIKQAIQIVEEGHEWGLIIGDLREKPLVDLEKFLETFDLTGVPVIPVLQKGESMREGITAVAAARKQDPVGSLKAVLKTCFDSGAIAPADTKEYIKIRTRLLLSVCPLSGDIFVQLNQAKYIKLFNAGDTFEASDWEKYTKQKGVDYLYIHRDHCNEFVSKYQEELNQMIKNTPSTDVDKLLKQSTGLAETLEELGSSVGFPAEVQQLAKTQVALTVKIMSQSPRFSDLMKWLAANRKHYLPAHSNMTSFIACSVASQCDWGSEATFQKLTTASLLHDMALPKTDLARFKSVEEVEKAGYGKKEQNDFKLHPIRGAELVKTFQNAPPDVDQIILQHHETPDGTGFPRGVNHSRLSPLSCIFIVAHDITEEALKFGDAFDLKDWARRNQVKYEKSKFRKVMEAVNTLAIQSEAPAPRPEVAQKAKVVRNSTAA